MPELIDNPDEIQDWEQKQEGGKGELSPAEEALMRELQISVRRAVNGCPELPGHTTRALQSTFSLVRRWTKDGQSLKAVR